MNKLLKINNDKAYFGINWALMNHCNYKCNYCHSDLNGGTIKHPKYEEVIFFVKKIIEHSSKLRFNPYFEFGGGEVTLLRYFPDLIRYICEHQGLVSIISNGSKSLKWWEQNVQFLNGVSLSYHVNDIKSETHFIKVAKILEASRITRLHVNVMMDPSQFEGKCSPNPIDIKTVTSST
ncbi:radical SAM family protein [Vibrio sp. ES.051]|uniref:radical SAM protein n=1 Tax=Vibrio sp. ES.051 TaxID=1761909 RepID=UPI000C00761F|nr:radical SAM protein [Vibrio sp. ES.051]PFG56471.1 radical SAM family protein [Vibrio sp. ES.051]